MKNNQKININYEVEKNILSIGIHSTIALGEIFSILNEEDFITVNYKIIFKSLFDLFINKISINITTLSNYMLKNNQLEKIGGIEFLIDLFQSYTTDAYLNDYLDIIIDNTTYRRLKNVINSINKEIDSNNLSINDILNKAEKEILEVKKERKSSFFKKSFDEVNNFLKKLEILEKNPNFLTGSPSGFYELDQITSGFQKGDFIILAARPSMGKTALALNFAYNCAKETKSSVVIFSIEMPSEQLIQRMICAISNVDFNKVRNGKNLSKYEWKNIKNASKTLQKMKLFIDDNSNLKIIELQSKLRKLCRENEISLVIIDYLQLLNSGLNNYESRQQEVSSISRQLKSLARELKIPIICLSQLSRYVEKREDKKPVMSDLRDSGAIEQDADIIMFLYRDDYYNLINNSDSENQNYLEKNNKINNSNSMTQKAQLILSKHRNGPTGIINFLFIKQYGTFSSYN